MLLVTHRVAFNRTPAASAVGSASKATHRALVAPAALSAPTTNHHRATHRFPHNQPKHICLVHFPLKTSAVALMEAARLSRVTKEAAPRPASTQSHVPLSGDISHTFGQHCTNATALVGGMIRGSRDPRPTDDQRTAVDCRWQDG